LTHYVLGKFNMCVCFLNGETGTHGIQLAFHGKQVHDSSVMLHKLN